MPLHAEVHVLYDGALRREVSRVWFTIDGRVGVGPKDEPLYHAEDRPVNFNCDKHGYERT